MKKLLIATVATLTLLSGAGISSSAHADSWKNNHNNHDWNKGRDWDRGNYYSRPVVNYYPRVYYAPPRERVVYVQPTHYFSQTFASPTTYTETYYPDGGYTTTYTVGDYLPTNRAWHPMPDYVRYGLASPGRGQRWVGNGRDALLITEATSRILSGVLLATNIN